MIMIRKIFFSIDKYINNVGKQYGFLTELNINTTNSYKVYIKYKTHKRTLRSINFFQIYNPLLFYPTITTKNLHFDCCDFCDCLSFANEYAKKIESLTITRSLIFFKINFGNMINLKNIFIDSTYDVSLEGLSNCLKLEYIYIKTFKRGILDSTIGDCVNLKEVRTNLCLQESVHFKSTSLKVLLTQKKDECFCESIFLPQMHLGISPFYS